MTRLYFESGVAGRKIYRSLEPFEVIRRGRGTFLVKDENRELPGYQINLLLLFRLMGNSRLDSRLLASISISAGG
jgi:hypothetical protein